MRVGPENVAQSIFQEVADGQKARVPGYLGAVCAALGLGAVIGLVAALLLPPEVDGNQTASLVSPAHAAPSLAPLQRDPGSRRAAPRLLYPESARSVPQSSPTNNPFLAEKPIRSPADTFVALPRPVIDQLDMPLADSVTVLASRSLTPDIQPISASDTVEASGRPQIAIVIDDLGLDEKATRRAISLPGSITLSFLPYGRASVGLAAEAQARGHEIMVHIPMEPEGEEDPGPDALLVDLKSEEISLRLAGQLDRFPGAIGFNNHMGSRFTADVRALLPVMREARARGLLFLDSRTTANTLAAKVAEAAGATTLSRDVFLDYAAGADGLLSQLEEVERTAQMTGAAIAIGHPHDLTLDILEVWTRGLDAKGFDLVSISRVASPDIQAEPGLLAASGL